eukprot:1154088-Pelagomonas_calceolata.AAC.7
MDFYMENYEMKEAHQRLQLAVYHTMLAQAKFSERAIAGQHAGKAEGDCILHSRQGCNVTMLWTLGSKQGRRARARQGMGKLGITGLES